jgi:hypothetical protein
MLAIFILHFSISIDQSSLSTTPLNFVPFGLRVKTDARQIPLGELCVFASNPRSCLPNSVIFRVIPWPQTPLPNFVPFVSFVVNRRAPISGVESRHEAYQEAPPSPHCHACFAADRNYESKIRVPKRPGRVKSNLANLREPKCQPLA